MKRLLFALLVLLLASSMPFAGGQVESKPGTPITIEFWHVHGGRLGEIVNKIADDFNASQSSYRIEMVYKGNYSECYTAGIAAFRAGNPPHMMQVESTGTASMMGAKEAIMPVQDLMEKYGVNFAPGDYISSVSGYYASSDGRMMSMPFNSSTPILWYSKDGFQKAGLDPNSPPRTWPDVGEAAQKLMMVGYKHGFSTSWPSWVQIENFSTWHNLPMGTRNNGFDGFDTELSYNSPTHVKHFEALSQWSKEGVFIYGGRRNLSNPKFYSEEVPIHTESSAAYAEFTNSCKFEIGASMLPYWPDVKGAPQNSVLGGASLWVFAGHSDPEYKAVSAFFSYISSPEVQVFWHQETGYLPITTAAYQLSKQQGFYDKNPGTEVPILQMTLNKPTPNSRGYRFGDFLSIRDINYEEMEALFAGDKSAKQALDAMVRRGNILLREFEKKQR